MGLAITPLLKQLLIHTDGRDSAWQDHLCRRSRTSASDMLGRSCQLLQAAHRFPHADSARSGHWSTSMSSRSFVRVPLPVPSYCI